MKPNWHGVSTEPTSGLLEPGKYRLRVYDVIPDENGQWRVQFTVVGTDRNGWKISDWIQFPTIEQWDEKDIVEKKKFKLQKARHLLHRLGIDTEREFSHSDLIGCECAAVVEIREKQTGGKVNNITLFSYEAVSVPVSSSATPDDFADCEAQADVPDDVPF